MIKSLATALVIIFVIWFLIIFKLWPKLLCDEVYKDTDEYFQTGSN